ncbi:hypothetical protein [Georgenia sp. Z1491]|uniref:hypothetical protein n=1 Tax=Georgenia sp. Z1491 TaxID=3416707 RepID=UPI003CF76D3E
MSPDAPPRPPISRRRWFVQGALLGVIASVLLVGAVGLLRRDAAEPLVTTYGLSDTTGTGDLRTVGFWVYDVRQPSAVPSLASPWGDRYVSLTGSLTWTWGADGDDGRETIDLSDLDTTLFAVDADGARTELALTERGQRAADRIGGTIQRRDPYRFWLVHEPGEGQVEHYELELTVDGADYTFVLTEGGR